MSRPSDRPTGSRFLENLAHLVPGTQGYRDRDRRRDEDSRLRAQILQRLAAIRRSLTDMITTSGGEPANVCAEILDERAVRLDGIADAIRYAPYGFSGFFDALSIGEAAIDRILEADLLLFEDLDAIERTTDRIAIHAGSTSRFKTTIMELDEKIEDLERHLITRDKLLGDV